MNIELKSITKSFGQKSVLKDLNLTFLEGRINCLMGPSGAGKTTIVNLLTGLILPDSGKMDGLQDKKISVVFQEDRLIEHWDAVKNIRLVCNNKVTPERVEQEFDKLNLATEKGTPVRNYSGGMRRRVTILRALFAEGDLVIMDEPFRGLDNDLKKQAIDYIRENTEHKTVIIITHDKEDVRLLDANLVEIC